MIHVGMMALCLSSHNVVLQELRHFVKSTYRPCRVVFCSHDNFFFDNYQRNIYFFKIGKKQIKINHVIPESLVSSVGINRLDLVRSKISLFGACALRLQIVQ